MRLFVAIPFSAGVRRGLLTAVESLRTQALSAQRRSGRSAPGPSFTQAENLHLTLAFIGETERVDEARAALADTVLPARFSITVAGSGRFGELFWAGIEDCPALSVLADNVRDALLRHGFRPDDKPFRPHITLARRLTLPSPPLLTVPRMTMPVTHIELMRSDRPGGRLRYTEIASVQLPGPGQAP